MSLREDNFNGLAGSREQTLRALGIGSYKTKGLALYQWGSIVEVVKP
jgi:hypothetical protein